eukprot:TRINITY_DN16219_c0_g1_i1.p1 TRINITY_DN16219_c0_g1~~TRINITY_DN16219_c0_g1_i1.p1  ORF type:complete len:339 (+),score=47.05 TRINITY_DN16219_c0_g1_i1:61-1077(+)
MPGTAGKKDRGSAGNKKRVPPGASATTGKLGTKLSKSSSSPALGGSSGPGKNGAAPATSVEEEVPKFKKSGQVLPGTDSGYGIDEPGPGDYTNGYRGPWPQYKATYWDLGRSHSLDPCLAHRPPSEWGVPHKHHFLSKGVYPPRIYQGQRSLLPGSVEDPKAQRPAVPEPTMTLRSTKGNFGQGSIIVKNGTNRLPVRLAVGEDRGQALPKTPPIAQEGDLTLGYRGMEPSYSSFMSQHGRVGFKQPEWGVPDKHHFMGMPTYPNLVHKDSIPNLPKKQEGDYSRGFAGQRPDLWSSYWNFGNDRNFEHSVKRYDFTPNAQKTYRFAVAREGFPGSSA